VCKGIDNKESKRSLLGIWQQYLKDRGLEEKMIEIGRLAVKIAGRDAGGICVVIDVLDKNFVLIDGQVRRRKCNIIHLEPLDNVIKVKKKASHEDVVNAFKELEIEVTERKPKQKTERPRKQRKKKAKKEELEKKVEKKGLLKKKEVKEKKEVNAKKKEETEEGAKR
jgi:large subunit ribosomal protein L14e